VICDDQRDDVLDEPSPANLGPDDAIPVCCFCGACVRDGGAVCWDCQREMGE
jgi:hypothetical protein